ncbi:MAG TPA: hemolysin III family protein [Polyangiaceae bacterium LLY-WYZ-15_(1-7)]|nr:DNA-binding protein [Sandaracinus sp.]MBJ71366.1 DNA-binding protein [Sandaracinus sp.]HJL06499.1 hemolysin III family protein [Polyangiaceae bacterium LLY-WYZ-15_(1-7)]HJL09060.1 hemolysin III family protein [Polyangiaceae bacterium LLY-WYZ-15_(1-7)]HJL44590.1 hemolysin III family protein [Polyangiaceae bacterium LLY-WYZ-15_(1-7)]
MHPAHPIPCPGFCDPVASWTHLLAAGAAFLMAPWLLRAVRGGRARAGLGVFLFGAVTLFALSGTYHLIDRGTVARDVLQRLDHAAIWTMIAGTITAIHVIAFRGFWRWGMTALVWTLAITGLVLKTVFFESIPFALGLGLYLLLGWMGMVAFARLRRLHGRALARPVLQGGLVYTAGALVELAAWPTPVAGVIGPHELFHVAVIGGAALHARGIVALARALPPEPARVGSGPEDGPGDLSSPFGSRAGEAVLA